MANGTKLPFQVQPARSPLILTSTKTSDSAYFCRGKKMEENCSLRLQPFTFSHEIIQSSFIHQNNGHHFQATTTMIELLLFHFYPFLMISNFEFGPALSQKISNWGLTTTVKLSNALHITAFCQNFVQYQFRDHSDVFHASLFKTEAYMPQRAQNKRARSTPFYVDQDLYIWLKQIFCILIVAISHLS